MVNALATLGTAGVFLVLFVETGLLVGSFLPGDSLLFTAGLLTATGAGSLHLSLRWVLVAAVAGAVLGAPDRVGRRASRGPSAAGALAVATAAGGSGASRGVPGTLRPPQGDRAGPVRADR